MKQWGPWLLTTPLCAAAGFLFLAPYMLEPGLLQVWWWAGLHVWGMPHLTLAWCLLVPLVPLLVLGLPRERLAGLCRTARNLSQAAYRRAGHPAFVILVVIIVAWIFRSSTLMFGDSQFYVSDLIPSQAASERGLVIMYDSVGATMLYSLGYSIVRPVFALEVLTWYQVAGLATLAVFLCWALLRRSPTGSLAAAPALLLLFSGNWSQATLGSPEHYGQLLLASLAYAILALEALDGRQPLWKPCLAFAIGAFFHLGIVWLLPSLVYLFTRRWRHEQIDDRWMALLAIVIPALLTGGLLYYFGFDLSFTADSNAARGKLIPFLDPTHPYSGGVKYHYSTFDLRHLAHIGQEMLLMGWPGLLVLAASAMSIQWRALLQQPGFQFLLVFFAGTLVFNLLWNPDLEFWRDQDLFSIIGLALCLLGTWPLLTRQEGLESPQLRLCIYAMALAGGLAWRAPVVLYHSVYAINYFEPGNLGTVWPFPE